MTLKIIELCEQSHQDADSSSWLGMGWVRVRVSAPAPLASESSVPWSDGLCLLWILGGGEERGSLSLVVVTNWAPVN